MKTCLEVEDNRKDGTDDLTFPAQDCLLNLQEKMNRLKEISSYLRTHFFSRCGSRGMVGIGKGFFVI